MPFKPGQSGNPNGTLPAKLMRDALMIVLHQKKGYKGRKVRRLQIVADKLVCEAEQGNVIAIKEILDRVDGKVPSDVKISTNKALDGQSFEELAQGIAEAIVKLRGTVEPQCSATSPQGETEPPLIENAPQPNTR